MLKKDVLLFLLCFATAFTAMSQETRAVHFSWGVEYFPNNFETAKYALKAPAESLVKGKYVRYIQFDKTLNAVARRAMEALDITVVGYTFPATYLLMLPINLDVQALEPFAPRSVLPLKPEWKMAKSLREPPYGAWAVHGEWIDVDLQVYPNVSIEEAAAQCRENGMMVLKEGNQNGFVLVRMLKEALAVNAALPFIRFLELAPPPGEKEDTKGRSLHRSNMLDSDAPMGKKYNGAGVRTLVRDDGQVGPHIDFQGRLQNITLTPPAQGKHGDGVAGILGGAGNIDPTKKGMAAGAEVYVIDYYADFQDQTLPLHLSEGITITNSSYSNGCNTGYTLASQTVDKQLFEHPTLMHVFSGGNSNNSNCGYGAGTQWGNITGGHKMSKNAVAVANIGQDGTLDGTSSRGPAHDGRLKPDISANGTNHFSTSSFNTYQEFGGTSGAAPGVAGCLAQLTQAYKTLHTGEEPKAVLLKAAILNTANDLGNAGPDFKFGWGHINAWRALSLLEQNNHLSAQVDQGTKNMHSLQVPANVKQARVMIVWSDPPADPDATRALLNDLDLTLVSPDGTTTYLPWKLNPTPNAALLNMPAGMGRDSLNNVEQVAINDPLAGDYAIFVTGTDVPLGPQEYHLVWEFIGDEVKLTYPAGGEGFVAGQVERLHWDAFGTASSFTLRYSTDGGATFDPLTTVPADKRMYDWTVPNTLNGKVMLLVMRDGQSDTSDFPLTIAPIPQNVRIDKICPDSMTVSWDEVNDSLSYDVYVLGNKYMEIVGTADTSQLTFPIASGGLAQWIAVRTSYADGTQGRRSYAVNWPGELKNCPQGNDIGLRKLLDPAGSAILSCSAFEQPVTIRIRNEGIDLNTGAIINYQLDDEPIVSEIQPDVMPGDSIDFTFQTPVVVSTNGMVHLKIWSSFPSDITNFNDTLSVTLPVAAQAVSGLFQENFEASSAPPMGWVVVNPDGGRTWELSNSFANLIGINNDPTRAYFLNHYQYAANGELDNLYMVPLDFSNVAHPALVFDLAHLQYSAAYMDGLRVELFPNCDLSADPVVVYEKNDPELSTGSTSTAFFIPDNGSEWRHESVGLDAYAGQTVIIRFVSINGYGNNTFLDNISIENLPPPVASIQNPADTICRNTSTVFEVGQPESGIQYNWNFGNLSIPGSATGPGPHTVSYPAQGSKTITLTATNAAGSSMATHSMYVRPFPASNFSQTANNLIVTFNNTSSNATAYFWDFGDGMTSVQKNPVHSYAAPGAYTVTLEAMNPCSTAVKTLPITLTSKVNDLSDYMGITILPNPTDGDFMVKIESRFPEGLQLSLLDAQGRLIKTVHSDVKQGVTNIAFEGLGLAKGIYQLNLAGKSGVAAFSIVVL